MLRTTNCQQNLRKFHRLDKIEEFSTLSVIGRGGCSNVLLVRHLNSNLEFALKIVRKKKKFNSTAIRIENEILNLSKRSPFIVPFY